MTLSEIADVLEGHLSGRIVHFGSCSTMRTKRANIDDFMMASEASMLSGYKKIVSFVDSTAWEMVWLQSLQGNYMPQIKSFTQLVKRFSWFVITSH